MPLIVLAMPSRAAIAFFFALPLPLCAEQPGDWCAALSSQPGKFYDNPENPYLQSILLTNRIHWQGYYFNGEDSAGDSFHHSGSDIRRFRPKLRTTFLHYFTLDLIASLVADRHFSGGGTDWQFQDYDNTVVNFDIRKAFTVTYFDHLDISYGRQKLTVTKEALQGADDLITIERSAISNQIFGGRYPTGVNLRFGKKPWLATLGYFPGIDGQSFDNSSPGEAWYAAFDYTLNHSWTLRADAVLNRFSALVPEISYDWATSINATYDKAPFGLIATVALGDNGTAPGGRGGNFGGAVLMPWIWIVPEKTQAVLQYNYSTSDQPAAIRANNRYLATASAAVNSSRGDELHSIYLGVNQYLCGNALKLLAGIEYEHLRTPAGNVEALTAALAVRMYF